MVGEDNQEGDDPPGVWVAFDPGEGGALVLQIGRNQREGLGA